MHEQSVRRFHDTVALGRRLEVDAVALAVREDEVRTHRLVHFHHRGERVVHGVGVEDPPPDVGRRHAEAETELRLEPVGIQADAG